MARLPPALVLALVMLAAPRSAVGQARTATTAEDTLGLVWARKLLAAMHAEEALREGLDSAFAAQRRAGNPQMPPVFFDSLTARFRRVAPQLVDSLATVYAAQLSVADLKALVQFYQSPLGQRYATAQVAFQLRSGEVGKRWGMRLALDVMKDLLDKGLITDFPH
jgi:uncharacterized protein